MKKKIRWKLLGSLRVHHQHCFRSIVEIRSLLLSFAILLLFSFAIFSVDAKLLSSDQPVSHSNASSSHQKSSKPEFLRSQSLQNLTSSPSDAPTLQVTPLQSQRKLHRINCSKLEIGQFVCPFHEIDLQTQQPIGCNSDNLAPINCTLRDGLICDGDNEDNGAADKPRYVLLGTPCEYTNGYSFEITLLLSIFLGMFGADRFYLGYPAIGLLKMCTLGFLFLGQFIDIILIAMQIVLPADNSNYIIKQFGPKLSIIKSTDTMALSAIPVTDSSFDVYFYLKNSTVV